MKDFGERFDSAHSRIRALDHGSRYFIDTFYDKSLNVDHGVSTVRARRSEVARTIGFLTRYLDETDVPQSIYWNLIDQLHDGTLVPRATYDGIDEGSNAPTLVPRETTKFVPGTKNTKIAIESTLRAIEVTLVEQELPLAA